MAGAPVRIVLWAERRHSDHGPAASGRYVAYGAASAVWSSTAHAAAGPAAADGRDAASDGRDAPLSKSPLFTARVGRQRRRKFPILEALNGRFQLLLSLPRSQNMSAKSLI